MTRATRLRLTAVLALLALACVVIATQPLGASWWIGGDSDGAYVSSSISLFGGHGARYFDHPGVPLQEMLAASMAAGAAVAHHGESRSARADAMFRRLDSARPYFRTVGVLCFLIGLALAVAGIALTFGDWAWGALGGVLFLALPQLGLFAAAMRPDLLLAGASVGVVALLVAAFRRRSGVLYAAAAALLGWTLSVKLQVVGLLLPFAIAVVLRPPQPAWTARAWNAAKLELARRRRLWIAVAAVWLALVITLNIGTTTVPRSRAVALVVAVGAIVAGSVGAARLLSHTRVGAWAELAAALLVSALTGLLVPNLFYAGTLPTMVRWIGASLTGGGVNGAASPGLEIGPRSVWLPYVAFAAVAAIGLARGLARREWEWLLWASGALAMATLATARMGELHYFQPALALLLPLILRAAWGDARPVASFAAATVLVCLLAVRPYITNVSDGRGLTRSANRANALNGWALARLGGTDAALTTEPNGDSSYRGYVEEFANDPPTITYRLLDPTPASIEYAMEHGLRIRYVVDPAHAVDPASLGLHGHLAPTATQGVYRLTDG